MEAILSQYGIYAFAGAALVVTFKLFKTPFKWVFRFLGNTVLGYISLLIFNVLGGTVGVQLGFNLINGLVIGILGLPGLVLLLLLRWLFHT